MSGLSTLVRKFSSLCYRRQPIIIKTKWTLPRTMDHWELYSDYKFGFGMTVKKEPSTKKSFLVKTRNFYNPYMKTQSIAMSNRTPSQVLTSWHNLSPSERLDIESPSSEWVNSVAKMDQLTDLDIVIH